MFWLIHLLLNFLLVNAIFKILIVVLNGHVPLKQKRTSGLLCLSIKIKLFYL